MFTAALFTIAKTRKQTKCPSTDEWIQKMWYVYNGILFIHKKNEILPFPATWIDLEDIILSEIKSDRERQILYDIIYVWNLKNTTN